MALPAFLLPGLIGGGLGALTNRDDPLRGGLLGAGLGAGGAALGGLLAPAAPAAGGAGTGGGLLATAAPEFGAAGLSQGAAASALGGGALPAAAGEAATLGLSQPAAAQALGGTDPIVQEFFSKGFKNKLTTGLIDAAPTAAAALLRPGQQAPTAPAGQLNRPQFTPAQNLFLNFQRRRR